MFNGRKSLMIAVSVVMMLAMLVPAAMAAPEVLHGVSIDSPTTGSPAYINAGHKTSTAHLYVEFTVTIDQAQVDDVYVCGHAVSGLGTRTRCVRWDWPSPGQPQRSRESATWTQA